MRYVFGPLPSRRLGRSLGVDPIPLKTCNWNCVYCQLGRTSPLTSERAEPVPAEDVVADVAAYLEAHGEQGVDWITFVGSGEPTLHARLGWMIREVKALTSRPVAVITNGELLSDPRVREELRAADAVMPTISAGTEAAYLRIHRPAHGSSFERFVDGLVAFREVFEGQLWAEVMLLEGFNDSEEELRAIAAICRRVRPDAIQLVLPTRPPTVPTVQAASPEAIARAVAILSEVAPVSAPTETPVVEAGNGSLDEAIVGLVQRHPMTDEELRSALTSYGAAEVDASIARLRAEARIGPHERGGRRYWSSGARL